MQFLKNLKVRNKLTLLIAVSLFVAISIAVLSFNQTNKMSTSMEKIYEEKFVPNNWINNAIAVNLRINSIITEMMLVTNPEEKQALFDELNTGVDQVLSELAMFEALDLTDDERQSLASFYDAVERLTNNHDEVIRLALEGQEEEAWKMFVDIVREPRKDLISSLDELREYKELQTEDIVLTNIDSANESNIQNIAIAAMALIVLLVLGILISKMITSPIMQLREQLGKVQNGDFTVQGTYTAKDELGHLTQSFNDTFHSLNNVLVKVKHSAEHVDDTSQELMANVAQSASAAEHVVASIQEISAGADQTKDRLEENAIIIDRVANGFTDILQSIQKVERLSSKAYTESMAGSTIVERNVEQMHNIKQSIQQSNDVIEALAKQVGDVDEILKVIDNISQQTNLLALNAAIEAARAGDHGKGFAVVADEVRTLAEQSLNATKSIATILANIKQDTAQSVQIMDVVTKEADNGLLATQNTSLKFQDILTNTEEVAPFITQTTHCVESIVEDFERFTSSADTILQIAINNSKNSELVSASSEQQAAAMEDMNYSSTGLAEVATELNDIVKKFKLS